MGNVIQRWITSVIFQQAPTSVIMRAREKTTVVLLRAWEYPKTGFKLHRNRWCENDRTACWMWRPGLSLLDAEARALPAGCGGQGSPCCMWRPGLSLLDVEARALPAGCGGQDSPCWMWRPGLSLPAPSCCCQRGGKETATSPPTAGSPPSAHTSRAVLVIV